MLSQRSWKPRICSPAAAQHCRQQGGHPRLPPPRAAPGDPPQQQRADGGASSAASGSSPAGSSGGSDAYEFTYKGSDGRVKATFEQAFKNRRADGGSSSGSGYESGGEERAPWALSYQMSERYSMLWNDDLKARLLKRKAADELGISDEELEARLARLQLVLPDISGKLPAMRPQLVARLASEVDQLPGRLLQLKAIFPAANVALLAMRQPELVLGFDMARLRGIADELHALLPNLNIDLLVEESPAMLDVPGLRAAMEEAARIMPGLDVQKQMGSDPQLIFGFQRGSQLIPYDPPRPESEQEPDDDEYGAYYGSGV